jgi:hypothetical protein
VTRTTSLCRAGRLQASTSTESGAQAWSRSLRN